MADIIIDFPLRGKWMAVPSPSHHRYAFDFAAVDNQFRMFSKPIFKYLLSKGNAADSFSWERPVFAPFSGTIYKVVAQVEDRSYFNLITDGIKVGKSLMFRNKGRLAQTESYGGNYLIIDSGKYFAYLCHFKNGSIKVHEGEHIEKGALLGEIGNSGNSLSPHLHFQLMDGPDPYINTILPFSFRKYERWEKNSWTESEKSVPEKGEYLRFV